MTDETSRAKASPEGGQEQEPSPQATQQIVDMGSAVVKNRHGTVHCLTIVGQVEGHMVLPNNTKSTKYEHVLPLLASLEESDEVDGLVLLLNTVGGDIEAGLAIAELVAGMRLPTVTLVLGGGHSIGVPLAVCGKETFIAHTASMTIHPVRMSGTVIAAPETYRYFERIRERIVKFVAGPHHTREDRFRQRKPADAGFRRYGQRCGHRAVRRGGGDAGHHRPRGRIVRCAGQSVPPDGPAAGRIGRGGGGGPSPPRFAFFSAAFTVFS